MMTSSASLPIVDISPYLESESKPSERAATATALDKACRDFGFFYLVGHGVPETARQGMLRLGHEFFQLSTPEKEAISIFKSMDGVRGYERLGENITSGKRDVLEGLDIYREYPHPSKEVLLGAQLWPERPLGLRSTVLAYVDQLLPVGKALMQAMGDALGKEGSEQAFEAITADPFWGLKFNGYPPLSTPDLDEEEKGISCGEHTDYGGLTFLLADDHIKSALEVESKEGGWIKADPIPGAYVVNIGKTPCGPTFLAWLPGREAMQTPSSGKLTHALGDIINVLTNNEYTATVHRVIHHGNEPRVSIPLFFEPSLNSKVEPLKSCISEGLKVKKSEVTYYEHMRHMLCDGRFVESGENVEKILVNEISLKG